MASVSSVSSSSSSIYGTRNVISGLASGMDTETLIENAVSGYKTKISSLQQKRTKLEWQQGAYRSIIEKLSNFSDKYMSYRSSTNLMSASFFSSAVTVSTAGQFADKVSASGRTSSDVQILGVKQLAAAASYSVNGVGGTGNGNAQPSISGDTVDLQSKQALSRISGSLTINYGGNRSFNVAFGELDNYENVDEFAKAIDEKLGNQSMTLSDGTVVKANTRIGVRTVGESIEFYDKGNAGNTVYISAASGDLKTELGIQPSADTTKLDLTGVDLVNEDGTLGDYLSGKELKVTLDGVTKSVTLPEYWKEDGSALSGKEFAEQLQAKLNVSFGTGKITVDTTGGGADGALSLNLKIQIGSTMSISGDAAKALGFGENGASTYINTSDTLGKILGSDADWSTFDRTEADGAVTLVTGTSSSEVYYKDSKGNRVALDSADGKYYRVDNNGEYLYEFTVNDQVVGRFNKDTALESVMTAINSNTEAGVSVSYSKTTDQFQFVAKESGSAGRVEMGSGLANAVFGGGTGTDGQDAIFSMSVNGQVLDGITRSSNSFDVDGLTVNLKGTFGDYDSGVDSNGDGVMEYHLAYVDAAKADAVTFTSKADADKIVDAIRSMVEDYNAMATEIKNAYSTLPQQKSSGAYYEPLTDEDKEGMSESTVTAYEEKAKVGLLFGDSDLSSLYGRLLNAISMTGNDGTVLKSIGITTSYSNGLTTLSLDETQLRSALESDPDKVRDIFTKSKENGAATDGLMQALKTPVDMYGKTTGGKGILVEKAGSPLAATTLYQNTLQTQLNSIDEQIEKWQEKMTDNIDRYTEKFSQLEQLISQMNAQSSYLSQLSGGY